MAEISEPLLTPTDPPETSEQNPELSSSEQEPASQDDPKDSLRESKPGLKRLFLTLSVLFSFLIGVPFFWKSTEIYRAPLPFMDIDSLSTQMESDPLQFPCHFQAIFVGFSLKSSFTQNPDDMRLLVLNHMTGLTSRASQCGTCSSNYTVSVTMDSGSECLRARGDEHSCLYQCGGIGNIGFDGDDEGVDESLRSVLGDCSGSGFGGKVYSVVVVNRDEEVRAVVGKYRHAWIVGRVAEADVVPRVAEIFINMFVNGGKSEGLIHGEFMPVGADGRIVLSFNLLNADPSDGIYDWDFQKVDEALLAPVVEALGPVANISVESQVLYHTPKSSFSSWDEEHHGYIFSTQDLPFFVNSNEWHLDTSIAAGGRSKILQFVVYIPSAKECPLLLQLPDGEISKTNGFVSPMWGGVIVWNPHSCSQGSENKHPVKHTISDQDLQSIFEVFMGQFRQLFGLKSANFYVGTSGTCHLLASERGFTEWELDVLSRQHACFNLRSCATTLGSLSRLVQSLPRMIIMDEIGKQVKFSLEAAKLAQSNASQGTYNSSAVSSREARSLAEDAFFHSSIMSVSYYSFEHCFAVYSPFFMPVSMHIILAAFRELKQYKEEKGKYLAWKSKAVS